jgi:cell division ATPase FtsA
MKQEKLDLFVKLFEDSTALITTKGIKILHLKTINCGFKNIISDISTCFRIKPSEAQSLIKGIKHSIFNESATKEKALLGEVLSARINDIFKNLRGLIDEDILKEVSNIFLSKDEYYIQGMEALLSTVFEIESKAIPVKINITPGTIKGQLANFYEEMFG